MYFSHDHETPLRTKEDLKPAGENRLLPLHQEEPDSKGDQGTIDVFTMDRQGNCVSPGTQNDDVKNVAFERLQLENELAHPVVCTDNKRREIVKGFEM